MARLSTDNATKERQVLGKVFWGMMDLYEFSRNQQALLLQKSQSNRAILAELQKNSSLPDTEPALIVASQLAGIHKNLSIIYPDTEHEKGNEIAKKSWFRRKNYLFKEMTPMEFIFSEKNEVMRRLSIVRRTLDIERTIA